MQKALGKDISSKKSTKLNFQMDLIKDKIPPLVRKLAIPASVGTLFQTLYNIVDTFFAG